MANIGALTMNNVNNICIIGTTNVGVLSTLVAADLWHQIPFIIVDKPAKIAGWDVANLRHYEPGLEPLLHNRANVNVFFQPPNYHQQINNAQIIIIAADNKIKNAGLGKRKRLELTHWDREMKRVCAEATTSKIIIIKSQLPPDDGTEALESTMNNLAPLNPVANSHHVFWIPEFYSAGTALQDIRHPNRVLISACQPLQAPNINIIREFYLNVNWVVNQQIIDAQLSTAIMGTIGSNIILALKAATMNMLAELCEEMPANDIDQVQHIMSADLRINTNQPLCVSAGIGGPGLLRGIEFVAYLAELHHRTGTAAFFKGLIKSNREHHEHLIKKMLKSVNSLTRKSVGILGFSYKENTGDVINSAAIEICRKLCVEAGAKQIKIYDPRVRPADQIYEHVFHLDTHKGITHGSL